MIQVTLVSVGVSFVEAEPRLGLECMLLALGPPTVDARAFGSIFGQNVHWFHIGIQPSGLQKAFQSLRRVNIGRRQMSNLMRSIARSKDTQKSIRFAFQFLVKMSALPQTETSPQCLERAHRMFQYLKLEE